MRRAAAVLRTQLPPTQISRRVIANTMVFWCGVRRIGFGLGIEVAKQLVPPPEFPPSPRKSS